MENILRIIKELCEGESLVIKVNNKEDAPYIIRKIIDNVDLVDTNQWEKIIGFIEDKEINIQTLDMFIVRDQVDMYYSEQNEDWEKKSRYTHSIEYTRDHKKYQRKKLEL